MDQSFKPAFSQDHGKEHLPSGGSVPIVSPLLFAPLMFVMLTLPNIIFSGIFWFETLHLIKWAAVFIPAGIMVAAAGFRVAFSSEARKHFLLDPFGALWLLLVLFVLMQPLWAPVTSIPTFTREWFFFSTLWGVYVVSRNGLDNGKISLFLWAAAVVGVLNVIFAELQIREMHGYLPFVYPTPGKYIGNTGQQNMFGLWIAMAMLGSSWMFVGGREWFSENFKGRIYLLINLVFLSVNSWGLWNSTSRSAVFSFVAGLLVISCLFFRSGVGRKVLFRLAVIAAILTVTFYGTIFFGRGNAFVMKAVQMVEHFQTVGKRDSIWLTTWEMFKMHPVRGVGMGHYKWNYLEAQRRMLEKHPGMKWQYTYWAHSEVFQWFCETGIFGGLILAALGSWWLKCLFSMLKREGPLSPEGVWASSFLFLIWFNALWTRPFHRIEDALWMALAFGLANREVLPSGFSWTEIRKDWILRSLGLTMCAVAVAGLLFFARGMGGDRLLRRAHMAADAAEQRQLIEKAEGRLMVRDIAQRELAYHNIRVAREQKKGELLAEGLMMLHQHFRQQPHSRELARLMAWYSDVREPYLLESVARYLRPGSYSIRDGQLLLSSEDFRFFFGSK